MQKNNIKIDLFLFKFELFRNMTNGQNFLYQLLCSCKSIKIALLYEDLVTSHWQHNKHYQKKENKVCNLKDTRNIYR